MQLFYKGINEDIEVCKNSSSGGIFSALSEWFLNQDSGVVYGCILDKNLNALHIRGTDSASRDKMRGSKYIQSDMSTVYSSLEKDLQSDKYVLFTGTPCQVQAVKTFVKLKKINDSKLTTVDLICHGVGSNLFFEDYIKNLENKFKSKAILCNFRAKYHPGQKQDMSVEFENGKVYHASSTKYDWFYSIYLKNLILRPSCYICPYAEMKRVGDISIADLWVKNEKVPKSLLVVNSEKGDELLKRVKPHLEIEEIKPEDVHQPHMHRPCDEPSDRTKFWDIYNSEGYLAVQKVWKNNTFKTRIKDSMARAAYTLGLAKVAKKILRRR